MVTFADPVDGVPFTDPDGLDDRTLWLRAFNGVGELVASMVLATGDVTFYVDTGDGWEQFGATVPGSGATTVRDDEGDLAFQIAKSVGFWGELWVDGALQSSFTVDDCDPGPGATAVSTVTGETWTAGNDVWVAAVDRKVWYSVLSSQDGEFSQADNDVLDIGTGDFTVAALVSVTSLAAGPADLRMLFAKFNPAQIGTTGVGWGLVDYAPLGGPGFVWNDGTGLHAACGGTWTANTLHLLVATGDRDGLLSFYLDDMTTPAATADLSAAGTLTNSEALDLLAPTDLMQVAARGKWDRVLTAGERAALTTQLEAA